MRLKRIRLWRDDNGEFRWTLIATNGKIIGASTEGYKKRYSALANLKDTLHISELKFVNELGSSIAYRNEPATLDDKRIYAASGLKPFAYFMED